MPDAAESLPEAGQFVIVEDWFGRDAVARWSPRFGAWFAADGDPILMHPTRWRPLPADSSPKCLPGEGQLVIVEDASGETAVARWSYEIEEWFGSDGNPVGIKPVNWRAIPAEPPPSSSEAQGAAAASRRESKAIDTIRPEEQFAFEAPAPLRSEESVGSFDEAIDADPMPAEPAQTVSRGALPRRSLPILPIALISIASSAVLVAAVSSGYPAREYRALLTWLPSFGPTSAASHLPVQRELVEAPQEVRAADADGVLKAANEDVAPPQRANKTILEERPEQGAVEQNEAPAQRAESAKPVEHESVVTSDIAAPKRSMSEATFEMRLARAPDDPGAVKSGLDKPADTAQTSKLLERASRLLKQGDIGGARLVLAFAHELGSPRAAFMLAETYDPQVLSTLKAVGALADARKARELYADAYAGGIAEAKTRSDALSE